MVAAPRSRHRRGRARSSRAARSFPAIRGLPDKWRAGLVPGLLTLAVLAGGASAAGTPSHVGLQLGAAVVLFVAAFRTQLFPMPDDSAPFMGMGLYALVLALVQLVPLPRWIRLNLPGGEDLAAGFAIAGIDVPALPLSVAPAATAATLFAALVPLSLFVLALKITWSSVSRFVETTVMALIFLTTALGLLQLVTGPDSPFYLYAITDRGAPVGLFANVTHQATFCLMAIPFLAVSVGRGREEVKGGFGQKRAMALPVLAAVLSAGTALATASVVAAATLPPVLFMGSLFVFPRRPLAYHFKILAPVLAVLAAAALLAAVLTGRGADDPGGAAQTRTTPLDRAAIRSTSAAILSDYWLTGAGLGAFPDVYGLYEDPEAVTDTYINHAHNDYLEWLVETGLAGLVLLVLFFRQTGGLVIRIYRHGEGRGFRLKRAACVALAVPFVHSLFEYPLRTPAIATFSALCLAIMIAPVGRSLKSREDVRRKAVPTDAMGRQVEI